MSALKLLESMCNDLARSIQWDGGDSHFALWVEKPLSCNTYVHMIDGNAYVERLMHDVKPASDSMDSKASVKREAQQMFENARNLHSNSNKNNDSSKTETMSGKRKRAGAGNKKDCDDDKRNVDTKSAVKVMSVNLMESMHTQVNETDTPFEMTALRRTNGHNGIHATVTSFVYDKNRREQVIAPTTTRGVAKVLSSLMTREQQQGAAQMRSALSDFSRTARLSDNYETQSSSLSVYLRDYAHRLSFCTTTQVTQLLLVLALEPIDLSLNIALTKNIDEAFIVENLLDISNRQESGVARPIVVDDVLVGRDLRSALIERQNKSAALISRYKSTVRCMSVNLFSRFPELAVQCDETTPIALLRALFSFWAVGRHYFENCIDLPQSCVLRNLQHKYTPVCESAFGTRADLLYATLAAHIKHTSPQKRSVARDIALMALGQAETHVAQLLQERPLPEFARAVAAFRSVCSRLSASSLAGAKRK